MEKLPIELDVWYNYKNDFELFKIEKRNNSTGFIMCNRNEQYVGAVDLRKTGFSIETRQHCGILMKGFVKFSDIKKYIL